MKTWRENRWCRRLLGIFALGLFAGFDLAQFVHGKLRGNAKNIFRLLLVAALGSVTLTSLYSLFNITTDMQELTSDNVIGVESAVEIRRLLVATHLGHDRNGGIVDRVEIDRTRHKLRALQAWYMTGAFEDQDKENARIMLETAESYLGWWEKAVDPNLGGRPPPELDRAFERALATSDHALNYNMKRLRRGAEAAGSNASKALRLSNRIWVLASALTGLMLLVTLADARWSSASSFGRNERGPS